MLNIVQMQFGYMYDMQLNLQNVVAEKEGVSKNIWESNNLYDNSNKITYFLSCFITEYWEYVEAKNEYNYMLKNSEKYSDKELNSQLLELKYEIIDQYHFLMNMFIYGKISKEFFNNLDLIETFNYAKIFHEDLESEEEITCALMSKLGEYLNKYPYKSWKKSRYTEDQLSNLPANIEDIVNEIIILFIKICRFWINDATEFWSLYYTKNLENIERQNNKSKGYIK